MKTNIIIKRVIIRIHTLSPDNMMHFQNQKISGNKFWLQANGIWCIKVKSKIWSQIEIVAMEKKHERISNIYQKAHWQQQLHKMNRFNSFSLALKIFE